MTMTMRLILWLCVVSIRCSLAAYAYDGHFTLAAKSEVTVYRAFGGDARAQGFSWTTKDPRTVSNFRDAAGCHQAERVEQTTRLIS